MLITTFQLQYCQSSSGNEVNYLHVTICSTLVHCYWRISILIIISVARWCSLIGLYRSAVVLFDHVVWLWSVLESKAGISGHTVRVLLKCLGTVLIHDSHFLSYHHLMEKKLPNQQRRADYQRFVKHWGLKISCSVLLKCISQVESFWEKLLHYDEFI